MRTVLRAITLAGGTMIFTAEAQSQEAASDCRLKQLASFDVTVTRDTMTTPVILNGATRTLEVRLDSSFNTLTTETVKDLDLSTKTFSVDGVTVQYGKFEVTQVARVAKVQFGGVSASDVQFLVAPQSYYLTGAAGQLGDIFLTKQDFDLDLGHGKLNLFSPDHCPKKVVYWATSSGVTQWPLLQDDVHLMYSPMTLDGEPVLVKLGRSGPSIMGMNVAYAVFGIKPSSPSLTEVKPEDIGLPSDFNEGSKIYSYPFATLSAGGVSVTHPRIYIYDQRPDQLKCRGREEMHDYKWENHPTLMSTEMARCFGGADVSLSLATLDKLHLYFSFKEKAVYATAGDGK